MRSNPPSTDENGSNVVLHPIGDAAALAGVSRSLLRLWERDGLIAPRRSSGGHRLYSSDDIARLRQIARLRRLDGLNTAAIRRELGIGDSVQPHGANGDSARLGQRLRALRSARGLSLASVADRSGLSISFLSAVERGQSNISVGNLFKLADAYGTTVPALGTDRPPEERHVLHPADRSRYVAGGGKVIIEDLIANPGALEAQYMEIGPGGGSEEAYTHPGEEFIYVLSGSLSFWIDERDQHTLESGDTLYFPSTRPHRWRNDGVEPVRVIWINVPLIEHDITPPERGSATRRHKEGA